MRSLYKSEAGHRIIAHWCRARLDAWTEPHRREAVAIDGATAHLTFVGEGRPEVVFVPGTNFNAATCLPVAEVLGRRWPTVVVDMPGQPGLGSGERPRSPLRSWYGDMPNSRDWPSTAFRSPPQPGVPCWAESRI